jgi:uncharacterized membrane protein (Fun14 family)
MCGVVWCGLCLCLLTQSTVIIFRKVLFEDISIGTLLGLATGFALRILGKSLLLIIGVELIFLQYLAWKDLIRINWAKITATSEYHIGRKREYWRRFVSLLTYKIPFKIGFISGLYIGLINPFK